VQGGEIPRPATQERRGSPAALGAFMLAKHLNIHLPKALRSHQTPAQFPRM